LAVHWFLEHYISPEVAAVYDAVTTIVEPSKIGEKLGIKGVKLGIKVISRNKVLIGLFKDNKVVKEITYASKETAEWVANKLGKEYISKIVEKYVVRDGGLKKGEDFDSVVGAMQKLYDLGITSGNARRLIIDRGWDVKKLERILEDVKSVNGGNKLISVINRDLKNQKDLGPIYEAEIVSHLKRSGWMIREVEKNVYKPNGQQLTEIDIIAEKNGRTVYIECKRSFGDIKPKQILTQAEYAKSKGVRKIYVYYSEDVFSPGQHYRVIEAIQNAKSRFGVDVELVQLTSEFN
jgi:Holliday junction resolvase-like predicted endonuclease